MPIHFRFGWYQSPNGDGYNEMCCGINFNPPVPPGFIPFPAYQFYNPSDLAQGTRVFTSPSNPLPNFYNSSLGFYWRGSPFTGQPFDPSFPIPWSATLIATDVVSFDVQILSPQSGVADFTDVPTGVFDTASSTNSYTINAVKVTLRVYDLKTRQTRQVTVIQDM